MAKKRNMASTTGSPRDEESGEAMKDNQKHGKSRLTLTQRKGKKQLVQNSNLYNFQDGLQKVHNLTRHNLRQWDDQDEVQLNMTKVEMRRAEPINFTQTLNVNLEDNIVEDFPYVLQDSLSSSIVEEEKAIHPSLDRVLEKKRLEALDRLEKARERRIESNRLMALYRLNLKNSLPDEGDGKSIYLTQEELKKIKVSKIKALQRLRQRPNAEVV
jgi:hypothetical protein